MTVVFNTPVLFLVFNRPESTRRVFQVIRQIKPARLFIAADGPRKNLPDEREICEEVRRIILDGINWPCEVKTLFRETNLGCGEAVSSAITWFFSATDEGIILEDDCLPDPTFFRFCEELLGRYRNDRRVMTISGSNLLGSPWKPESQSYCWGQGGIWGWATWKRAWALYDKRMQYWPETSAQAKIKAGLRTRNWFNFYRGMFEAAYNGAIDTWDVQWFYTILVNDGLSVNPSVNLVRNIGFGNGTHTHSSDSVIAGLDAEPMDFPLIHPEQQVVDSTYLKRVYKHISTDIQTSVTKRLLTKVRSLFRKIYSVK